MYCCITVIVIVIFIGWVMTHLQVIINSNKTNHCYDFYNDAYES